MLTLNGCESIRKDRWTAGMKISAGSRMATE